MSAYPNTSYESSGSVIILSGAEEEEEGYILGEPLGLKSDPFSDNVNYSLSLNLKTIQVTLKYCFLIAFMPLWMLISLLIEVIVVPLKILLYCIRKPEIKGYHTIFLYMASPFLLTILVAIALLISPISLAIKGYKYLTEGDPNDVSKLVFPENHPFFNECINPTVEYESQEELNISSTKINTSSISFSCGFDPILKNYEDPDNVHKIIYEGSQEF